MEGTLTPDLLERARALDISQAEAERLGAAATTRLIASLEARKPEPQFQPPPEYAFDPYTGKPLREQQPADELELPKTWVNPETGQEEALVWNPGLVDAIKKPIERVKQAEERVARLEQSLQQQERARAEQRAQSMFKQFDAHLAKAEDLHDVLGKGDQFSCTPTERQARIRLLSRIETIQEADQRAGLPPQDFSEIFEQAKASLYPAKVAQKATRQISEKARDASGQFISRPTQTTRASDLPKGDARAVAALEAKFREYQLY